MDIDQLRTVQTKERQKDSLQHLRDSFYEDVADYIQELKAERDRAAERADDPFSDPEVSRLTDEIETAEDVVEAIYERRVGKVVKLSSFAAADMPVDEEGLTAQERDLFDDLVDRIEQNKNRVLDILAGEGDRHANDEAGVPADAPDEAPAPPEGGEDRGVPLPDDAADSREPSESDQTDSGVLAEAMGASGTDAESNETDSASDPSAADGSGPGEPAGHEIPSDEPPTADAGGNPEDGSMDADRSPEAGTAESAANEDPSAANDDASADDTDRTTVRITEDVGRILGLDDREYELASEDVVTLPAANADALLQQDAAEQLE